MLQWTGCIMKADRSIRISRREALGVLGSIGTLGIVRLLNGDNRTNAHASNCVLTPEVTEGPYFVDEKLNRSDISDGQEGLPLRLNIYVYDANSSACDAIQDVQIDIWHTNGKGVYSDVPALNSAGQTFLRGYQTTDKNGNVSFATIYPGWYPGRTSHIHLKARILNASGKETLEATTQVFFDDRITDDVYANIPPYNSRRNRDTRNSQDGIYRERTSLLLRLSGDHVSGYTGSIPIGIAL